MPLAKVGAISLSYDVLGDGQPLVMINGFASARNGLFILARAFAKEYRVITFDNRGIGGSDKPAGVYTMTMMADDTIGLMDFMGIDKAHLLGMSLGGMVAQQIAIDHPERVKKLILCSTSAGGQPLKDMLFDLTEATTPGWNRSQSDLASADLGKLVIAMTSRTFNQPFSRWLFVSLNKFLLNSGTLKVPAGQLAAMLTHDVLDRLHLIQAPTLVMTGSQDRLMPPHSSEELAARIAGARLVILEGGSHSLEGVMSRFTQDVLDFLQSN
jgi:pimeloyl-ACP methyl ester carboxylesterase